MDRWTTQQVVDAAPDPSSVAAARKLAVPGPWSETGSSDTLLWGKCQGSGKTPYQVSIDLSRPAYRCSCPSRKFPCKHALALLLLWAGSDGAITDAAEPADYAAEWQATGAAAVAARAAAPEKRVDPQAQAKRLETRLGLMDAGIDDFSLWLQDLARAGLAAARAQPFAWWDAVAARLVDAQLPGLADQVRTTASDLMRLDDWSDHLLATVGRWWLTTHAWRQRDELDADTLADLRVELGWSIPSEDARRAASLIDTWVIVGAHRSDDGRVRQQRTWLLGDMSGELVVALDFAAGSTALPVARAVGSTLTGAVAPYAGHAPRRVLIDDAAPTAGDAVLPRGVTLHDGRRQLAHNLAQNPWLVRHPFVAESVRFAQGGVIDGADTAVRYTPGFDPTLALALTGAEPVRCFGELEGGRFRPLTIQVADRMVSL